MSGKYFFYFSFGIELVNNGLMQAGRHSLLVLLLLQGIRNTTNTLLFKPQHLPFKSLFTHLQLAIHAHIHPFTHSLRFKTIQELMCLTVNEKICIS